MPKITKTLAASLEPGKADVWLWDTDLPGFGVRCTPSGRKTYVARYRTRAGIQRKQAVGRVCDMAPDKARELARALFVQVAEGADPLSERRDIRSSDKTVESMFKAYVASLRAKGKAIANETERALLIGRNNAAEFFGANRRAADITSGDIVNYVGKIYREGKPGAADHHRGYVSAAFGWAIKSANDYTVENPQDWGVTRNPVSDVARDPKAKRTRDRNLNVDELGLLWRHMAPGAEGFAPETAACVRLLIACGQRVQETLRLEAHELDLANMVWNMPKEKTKMQERDHLIPLPAVILPDLRLLLSIHRKGYLFIAKDGKSLIKHTTIMQALERWAERNKIEHFQSRDLRRTWKSRAHDAGVSKETRDLIQQHAKNDTSSKHYDRAEYMPQKRAGMNAWSDWIELKLEMQRRQEAA